MAERSSAEKQAKVAEKKRLHNKSIRTLCRSSIAKAERLISSGKLEAAQTEVVAAVCTLDKAAGKKVIHPNNAARRKSRLMKKMNEAKSSASAKKTE